ncbi:MAG: hypothetical protein HYT87_05000 [Nitrospirae bacterium]|nr:hypothetical protein [Nitrospirota bacterium]
MNHPIRGSFAVGTLLGMAVLSCSGNEPNVGLAPRRLTDGPRIVFELTAKPFPKIPFPNNVATRIDPSSPTGRRVNASLVGPTLLERDIRAKVDRLSGFSTISAITVSFDSPLDLQTLIDRHQKNHDLADDAVYVFNLDRPEEEPVEIDMGRGNFPVGLEETSYFDNDPRAGSCTILFETVNEDLNGNGLLDPGEDTNDDGRLGVPNFKKNGTGNCYDDLVTFYDLSDNTLILKTVAPLREETNYAVVLTTDLIGENGQYVESPFEYINHTQQTRELKKLPSILSRWGRSIDQVAFAWSFTTQSITRDLVAIRKGLYGSGPLKLLSDFTPPELLNVPPLYCTEKWKEENKQDIFSRTCDAEIVKGAAGGNPYTLKAVDIVKLLEQVISLLGLQTEENQQKAITGAYRDYVDYIVQGEFETPYFICNRWIEEERKCDRDDLGVFDIDLASGKVKGLGKDVGVFWLAVPKANPKAGYGPPFPVVFYGHGYTGNRVEFLGFAEHMAKFGFATVGMEAVGHGIPLSKEILDVAPLALSPYGLSPLLKARTGRTRDLNGDGVGDSGGDFFSADTFHTRDVVRQSVVDYMQLIRILRTYDGKKLWPFDINDNGQADDIAGDFNHDGTPDIGGPDNPFYAWGQSLGGILSSVLAGIEPYVRAAAPVSGGGGLIDIGARTIQGGVVEAVFLPLFGPMVIAQPSKDNQVDLKFLIHDVNRDVKITFARTGALNAGDWVSVENTVNGRRDVVRVHQANFMRAHITSDKGDRLNVTIYDGATCPASLEDEVLAGACAIRHEINTFGVDASFQSYSSDGSSKVNYPKDSPLVSLASGYGYRRNNPDTRRFMEIAQMIVDPADPANYATHYFLDPIRQEPAPPDWKGSNVLVIGTIGDMNVPLNTALMIARSAGILEYRKVDSRYGKSDNDVLIDNRVFENLESLNRFNPFGLLFDPDNLSDGTDGLCQKGTCPPRLDPPLRKTLETGVYGVPGVSGLRLPLTCPNDHLEEDDFQSKCGFGTDQHGFFISSPQKAFDMDTFMVNQIGRFFQSEGREIRDDRCLESEFKPGGRRCDFIPPSPQ